jgi:hypothetical protein
MQVHLVLQELFFRNYPVRLGTKKNRHERRFSVYDFFKKIGF